MEQRQMSEELDLAIEMFHSYNEELRKAENKSNYVEILSCIKRMENEYVQKRLRTRKRD